MSEQKPTDDERAAFQRGLAYTLERPPWACPGGAPDAAAFEVGIALGVRLAAERDARRLGWDGGNAPAPVVAAPDGSARAPWDLVEDLGDALGSFLDAVDVTVTAEALGRERVDAATSAWKAWIAWRTKVLDGAPPSAPVGDHCPHCNTLPKLRSLYEQQKERGAVVAYLRERGENGTPPAAPVYAELLVRIADAIERGDHRR